MIQVRGAGAQQLSWQGGNKSHASVLTFAKSSFPAGHLSLAHSWQHFGDTCCLIMRNCVRVWQGLSHPVSSPER